MIRTIFFSICLLTAIVANGQIFDENFNEGIPASFKIYDEDGLTPNQSMTGLGFKTGQSWISYTQKDEQGKFAASTSKYTEPGNSNDWLVTPKIQVPSQGYWLEWKALSCSKTSKSGYKVLISTSGSKVSNFTESPVFEISEENNEWTTRYISLDKYNGKDIYIAFINNSTDKYLLGIDDVKVLIPGRISTITSTTPNSVGAAENFTISGKIRANYAQALNAFTASYTCGNQTESQEFTGLNINPGEEYSFKFDKKPATSTGDTVRYSISVSIGEEKYTTKSEIVCYSFIPKRYHVIEETTGSWCGYCPAGHISMEYMKEKYPDSFIGIAPHNQDPMTVKIYDSGIASLGVDGYPTGFLNRKTKSFPLGSNMTPGDGGWETLYLNALKDIAPAEIDLSVEYNSEQTEVKLHSKITFALNLPKAKYNIAYVIKECNVKGSTRKYDQTNSYSGSSKNVGGYEDLPNPVPANVMVYHDVARAIAPYFKGDTFINKAITSGEVINSEYSMELPSTILNKNNLSFIALLIDTNTGEIVNANSFKFNTHEHEGLATFIKESEQENPEIFIQTKEGECIAVIKTANSSTASVGLYDLNGICLLSQESASNQNIHEFTLQANGMKGIYLLKVNISGELITRKIIF